MVTIDRWTICTYVCINLSTYLYCVHVDVYICMSAYIWCVHVGTYVCIYV